MPLSPETNLPTTGRKHSTGSASSMTSEERLPGFVQNKLPWIVGAGALVVFLLTLNQWINLRSLTVVSRVAGWDMELPAIWPLFFTLTYPFRFLPASVQPIALNLFSLVCATLTVILLARSVALLPQDRTHDQRIRERSEFSLLSIPLAWVPVVLACGTLAFQLTFWEHATSITGEMIDLLCFAYVIRCLLEYRISHDDKWFTKLAFVYGLAVTNNWAMIGFFPLFLGAIIWIKGIRFFDPGFLVKTALCGLAGLLLYFVLPAVWVMNGGEFGFWEVLKANLINQKMILINEKAYRNRALLLGLTSVLPVVLIGIRWRTHEGETNAAASFLTNLAFRVIHLFFLGACLWIAFDPHYSPRYLGLGLTYLTFYYLAALVIGYYSGYALVVFSEAPRRGRMQETPLGKLINNVVRYAILAAAVLVPAGLIYKNFATVRADNGAVLKTFAERIAQSLPPAPAYIFADEQSALTLTQAHLNSTGKAGDYVFANTEHFEKAAFHSKMRKRYGERWPLGDDSDSLAGSIVYQSDLQLMVRELATTNVVAYLHPSFGYFFEVLFPKPQGESYHLAAFKPEDYTAPPLTPEQLASNTAHWTASKDYLARVKTFKDRQSNDAKWVARYYSRALNTWGVELQRHGKTGEAGPLFVQAYDLNTNNIPARVNREFNESIAAGKTPVPLAGKTLADRFGEYRTWDRILADNGPFDHPDFCQPRGENLLMLGQYRQAALQFSRVIHFQPSNLQARLGYVKCLAGGNWLTEAIAELERIEKDFPNITDTDKVEIARVRAGAFFARGEAAKAEDILKSARQQMPEQTAVAESLFEFYRITGNLSNALAVINQQLNKTPTNTTIHLQKAEVLLSVRDYNGAHETINRALTIAPKSAPAQLLQAFTHMQEAQHDKAIAVLDRLLRQDSENVQALLYKGIAHFHRGELDAAREAFDEILEQEPDNQVALRNRAVLHLKTKRLGEAKEDYERLRKIAPRSHSVMYGLGEIAAEEGENADAIRYYEAYLKLAPKDGGAELEAESKRVRERIEQLRNPSK
jgi:tetratricopeptide (TPR) repeat protein